ncbi:hypothetical protein P3T39_006497 [Kitasatospora sp. GP82]|nr:hypothetical protein [Kitasatospora sp. GP82]
MCMQWMLKLTTPSVQLVPNILFIPASRISRTTDSL